MRDLLVRPALEGEAKTIIEQLGKGAKIDDLDRLVGQVQASSARLARALRPGTLDDTIVAAIGFKSAEFAERMGIPCRFRTNDDELLAKAFCNTLIITRPGIKNAVYCTWS